MRSLLSLGFLLFERVGLADDNLLKFFKNYSLTGDYIAGGVGMRDLRGLGQSIDQTHPIPTPTGSLPLKPQLSAWQGKYVTKTINIGGAGQNGSNPVPCTNAQGTVIACGTAGAIPADIVFAFLYYQVDESSAQSTGRYGFFDGHPFVGAPLGSLQNRSCDSTGPMYARFYMADVLRDLPIDPANSVRTANGTHTVTLRDAGVLGSSPYSNGTTLVLGYRILAPGYPLAASLKSVVINHGAITVGKNFADKLNQSMAGSYQALQTATPTASTRLTAVVSNGQPGDVSNFNVTTSYGTGQFSKAFQGTAGARWDNPTFNLSQKANEDAYLMQLTTSGQVCLTVGVAVTSTPVVDTDRDGLLDFGS